MGLCPDSVSFLTVRLYLPAAAGALSSVLFGIERWYPSQPDFSWYVLGSSYMKNKLKQRNHKTISAMISWGTTRGRKYKAVSELAVWRSQALEYSFLSPLLTPEAQCAGLVYAAVLNTRTENDLWRKGLLYFTGYCPFVAGRRQGETSSWSRHRNCGTKLMLACSQILVQWPFLSTPGPRAQGWHCPQWGGLSCIN